MTQLLQDTAERVQEAATEALRLRQKPARGESTITLPFGRRISAKPYRRMGFSQRKNWWLSTPWEMVLPQHLDEKYRQSDGTYLMGWPNAQEDGTQMHLSGKLFVPVLWKHVDKTKGARVRTHEGAKTRDGEGYVYWRRHILVYVDPIIWSEEHVEPVLRSLSLLASHDDGWQGHVEEKSQGLAVGIVERETEEVRGSGVQHRAGQEPVSTEDADALQRASEARIRQEAEQLANGGA